MGGTDKAFNVKELNKNDFNRKIYQYNKICAVCEVLCTFDSQQALGKLLEQ